jgi:hypothetical protein
VLTIVGAATSWTDLTSAICAIVAVTIGLPALAANFGQLRQARLATLAQLSLTLSAHVQRWDDPQMVEARAKTNRLTANELRDAIVDAYSGGAADDALTYLGVPNYFEDIGLATQQGALPRSAVTAALGSLTTAEWDHWRPAVLALRDLLGEPSVYSEFERLALETSAHRPGR